MRSKIFLLATIFLSLSLFLSTAQTVQAESGSGSSTSSLRTPKPTLEKYPEKEMEKRSTENRLASKEAELKKRQEEQKEKLEERKNKIASKEAELKDKMDDRMEKMASRAAEKFEDRCKFLTEKSTLVLTRFENNKTKHIEQYQNSKKKLEEVIARLKTAGANVTKLEADLVQLNTLIQKASDDYAAYITALKDTKNYACGKSEGAYANALKAAQEKLKTARLSLLEVRNYYQSTIRPDIQAAKASLPSRSPRATSAASSSPSPSGAAQ
jgi:DNA repair exonuclease SbcCD ATPase subunit